MRTRFQIEKRKDVAGNLLSTDRPVFMSVITMNKYLRLMAKDLGLIRMIYTANAGEEGFPRYSRYKSDLALEEMKKFNL